LSASAFIASLSGPPDQPSPHHLQRYALPDVRLPTTIGDQRGACATQHVDEARSNRLPVGIDLRSTARVINFSNRGDGVSLDRQIARDRRRSTAVVNHSVADDGVVVRRAAGAQKQHEHQQSFHHSPVISQQHLLNVV
jgi:hypothetical protein